MKPTPQNKLNASLSGRIIGYNNRSGNLYVTQNGLSQFTPKKNVIPPPVDYSSYSNKSNTNQTLEEMNSKKGSPPNFYEGNKEKLKVPVEAQPQPFTLSGGKPQ
jgi:hypothetical protein